MDVGKIIGLAVGLLVAAAVLPTAVVTITNTTNWAGVDATTLLLIPVIGIVVVASFLVYIYKTMN